MSHKRIEQWECDGGDCEETHVDEYFGGAVIMNGRPPSWVQITRDGISQDFCPRHAVRVELTPAHVFTWNGPEL